MSDDFTNRSQSEAQALLADNTTQSISAKDVRDALFSLWTLVNALDHGTLGGLADDDHAQYHTDARAAAWLQTLFADALEALDDTESNRVMTPERVWEAIAATVLDDLNDVDASTPTNGDVLTWDGSQWVPQGGVGAATDHGALTGLADDDHAQYHTDTRAQTWLNGTVPSQAEAEAGTATTVRGWTAQRIKQAIAALTPAAANVEDINGHIVTPVNKTFTLVLDAKYARTIDALTVKTASGTCTVNLKIDGVDVTSLSAVAVTSSESTTAASGANSVAAGATVTLTISSVASAADLVFSIKTTRT